MAFKVVNPGALTLVQDLGRYGYQSIGLANGGPMDEYAFRWANALLANDANAAQLEITFGGLVLEASASTSVALCGADLNATLNERSILPWQTYQIEKGDVLKFQRPKFGIRTYLAVKGGLQCASVLGSVSTVIREKLGGLSGKGEPLLEGDILHYMACDAYTQNRVYRAYIPDYSQAKIPLIPGYQYTHFSKEERVRFFSNAYRVSTHCDRMGYRMEGPAVRYEGAGLISEGIAYGAVQIPNDGQPIVLLRDRQTIGGYPKLGCITPLGGAILSQQMPGNAIRFYPITIEQEEEERRLLFSCINDSVC